MRRASALALLGLCGAVSCHRPRSFSQAVPESGTGFYTYESPALNSWLRGTFVIADGQVYLSPEHDTCYPVGEKTEINTARFSCIGDEDSDNSSAVRGAQVTIDVRHPARDSKWQRRALVSRTRVVCTSTAVNAQGLQYCSRQERTTVLVPEVRTGRLRVARGVDR